MKKILFILTMVASAMVGMAQNVDFPATEYTQDPKANFRLYKTKNTYNFIKLDTRTGQMEMVQWSTKSGGTFTYPLSIEKRVYSVEDEIPGRFTLYATTNFFNFVLLDQIDGRTWQVQWSTEPNDMMVIRIY
jgi:hypothetical protein